MKKKSKIEKYTDQEALDYHNSGKSGKIEINSSKPMSTQRDLALAYSPGVAAPVKVIAENPDAAYDYTTKRSEEHTSELQSLVNLVCRLRLEKKNYHSTNEKQ